MDGWMDCLGYEFIKNSIIFQKRHGSSSTCPVLPELWCWQNPQTLMASTLIWARLVDISVYVIPPSNYILTPTFVYSSNKMPAFWCLFAIVPASYMFRFMYRSFLVTFKCVWMEPGFLFFLFFGLAVKNGTENDGEILESECLFCIKKSVCFAEIKLQNTYELNGWYTSCNFSLLTTPIRDTWKQSRKHTRIKGMWNADLLLIIVISSCIKFYQLRVHTCEGEVETFLLGLWQKIRGYTLSSGWQKHRVEYTVCHLSY